MSINCKDAVRCDMRYFLSVVKEINNVGKYHIYQYNRLKFY